MKLGYNLEQVMIEPRKSVIPNNHNVVLHRPFKFSNGVSWTGIPLVVKGDLESAKIVTPYDWLSMQSNIEYNWASYKANFSPIHEERIEPENVIVSYSSSDLREQTYLDAFSEMKTCIFLSIEDDNSYSKRLPHTVTLMRRKHAKHVIIAGPVSTPEGVEALIEAGADIVRIGNPHSNLGIGVPTFTMIQECAVAARAAGVKIMYDSANSISDTIKAFAAGADFVCVNNSNVIETQEAIKTACSYLSSAEIAHLPQMAKFNFLS